MKKALYRLALVALLLLGSCLAPAASLFDTILTTTITNSGTVFVDGGLTLSNITLTVPLSPTMGGTGTNSLAAAISAGGGGNVFTNPVTGVNIYATSASNYLATGPVYVGRGSGNGVFFDSGGSFAGKVDRFEVFCDTTLGNSLAIRNPQNGNYQMIMNPAGDLQFTNFNQVLIATPLRVGGNATLAGATNTFNGIRLPLVDGTTNQAIITFGNGTLGFATPTVYGNVFSASNNVFIGNNTFSNSVLGSSANTLSNFSVVAAANVKASNGGTFLYTYDGSGNITTSNYLTHIYYPNNQGGKIFLSPNFNSKTGIFHNDGTLSFNVANRNLMETNGTDVAVAWGELRSLYRGGGIQMLDWNYPMTFGGNPVFQNDVTFGSSSANSVTFNGSSVALPNGLNFDSGRFKINAGGNVVVAGNLFVITNGCSLSINGPGSSAQIQATSDASQFLVHTRTTASTDGQRVSSFAVTGKDGSLANLSGIREVGFYRSGSDMAYAITHGGGGSLISDIAGLVVSEVGGGTPAVSIGPTNATAPYTLHVQSGDALFNSNIVSRSRGIVVSTVSATTNTLIQPFSGTYPGLTTNFTFGVTFATVPTVVITTTTSGGTAILNDTVWVSNVTITGYTIGYRTAAGLNSAATLTFNGIAVGQQ